MSTSDIAPAIPAAGPAAASAPRARLHSTAHQPPAQSAGGGAQTVDVVLVGGSRVNNPEQLALPSESVFELSQGSGHSEHSPKLRLQGTRGTETLPHCVQDRYHRRGSAGCHSGQADQDLACLNRPVMGP